MNVSDVSIHSVSSSESTDSVSCVVSYSDMTSLSAYSLDKFPELNVCAYSLDKFLELNVSAYLFS